jgi:hypothetical protein
MWYDYFINNKPMASRGQDSAESDEFLNSRELVEIVNHRSEREIERLFADSASFED